MYIQKHDPEQINENLSCDNLRAESRLKECLLLLLPVANITEQKWYPKSIIPLQI